MNVYDQAADEVRREHLTHTGDMGGWDCSCGVSRAAWGANATKGTATAAAQRHIKSEYDKILARLRAERMP